MAEKMVISIVEGRRTRWVDEMQMGILRIEMIEIGRQKWQG